MKRIFFFLLITLIISCSSDSSDPEEMTDQVEDQETMEEEENNPEEESLIPDLFVLGKTFEPNGLLSREIFEWELSETSQNNSLNNLFSELGINDINNLRSYYSKEGIVLFNIEQNPATGFNGYFPYFKNFNTGATDRYEEFVAANSIKNGWVNNENFIGLYWDPLTFDEADFTHEFLLKRINAIDRSEETISLGRFQASDRFTAARAGNMLYLYHRADFIGDPEASFFVIDLNSFLLLDTFTGLIETQFNMITDELANCYLFSGDLILKYDRQIGMLDEVQFPGNTSIIASAYAGSELEARIVNGKCFFGLVGPQPGPPFAPAIYDLETGEFQIIDISQEITQFEGDEFPWDPAITAVTIDAENNLLFFGVWSRGFAPEISSFGIFAVDFEGNVLEKKKIPFWAIALFQ